MCTIISIYMLYSVEVSCPKLLEKSATLHLVEVNFGKITQYWLFFFYWCFVGTPEIWLFFIKEIIKKIRRVKSLFHGDIFQYLHHFHGGFFYCCFVGTPKEKYISWQIIQFGSFFYWCFVGTPEIWLFFHKGNN